MNYGPASEHVFAFIESLQRLTVEDWRRGFTELYEYEPDYVAKINSALVHIDTASMGAEGLSDARKAAERRAHDFLVFTHGSGVPDEFYVAVRRAAGALVVIECAEFEKIVQVFKEFRYSSVALPLTWGD